MTRLPKVAYVMSRFPHLPETFILREMNRLRQLGWPVALYPLVVQRPGVIHDEARCWLDDARCPRLFSSAILGHAGAGLIRRPVVVTSLAAEVAGKNITCPGFLLRAMTLFPKAVHVARMMQEQGVEHIHAHYATHPALFAYLIHRLTGISYSVTVHAHDIFVRKTMLATKLRHAAFVVAISRFNREYLTQAVGPWVQEKTHVIHCGIDPDEYTPRAADPRTNNPSNTEPRKTEPFEIVSVGSLQPYKGFAYLIQACSLLRDRGVPVRCRIVGEGGLRPELQRLIGQAGLDGHVRLLGAMTQRQVSALLPSADCYVQPSVVTRSGKMEGIPVAIMEALACARPVVASRLSGIPELVEDGRTGYLTPPGDAAALCDCLARVHAEPGRAEAMGRCGRELVHREFLLNSNVERLAELFRDTIEAQRR
jgi:glycosyltransferase involved in cell wall biosynthesis